MSRTAGKSTRTKAAAAKRSAIQSAPAPIAIVVRRGALSRFDELQQKVAGRSILVSWDRRHAERRTSCLAIGDDRRQTDRRQRPAITWEVTDFVVVYDAAEQAGHANLAKRAAPSGGCSERRRAKKRLDRYWVVQPWGRHKGRQASRLSGHPTVAAAFQEIDRMSAHMTRTGVPSDVVELLVVDHAGQILSRPDGQ